MKISLFLLTVFTALSISASAQNDILTCSCPKIYTDTKPAAIFHLSNGKSIALCGSKESDYIKGKTLYSEFVLSVCGSNKIIKFWGAVQICNVRVSSDTLYVEELVDLPIGPKMAYKKIAWNIDRIYFVNNKIKRDSLVNPRIPKYNSSEIAHVLNIYKATKNQNEFRTAALIDKLLSVAYQEVRKLKIYLSISLRNSLNLVAYISSNMMMR